MGQGKVACWSAAGHVEGACLDEELERLIRCRCAPELEPETEQTSLAVAEVGGILPGRGEAPVARSGRRR